MFASKAQADATRKLVERLESENANPVVLDLGKSWDELSAEQQQFLIEQCEGKRLEVQYPAE